MSVTSALSSSHQMEIQPQLIDRDHLQNLNPEQLAGVQHYEGPILILAGAGTGKTRVLTRRIVHLIREHNVRPYNILAVTFTNKATEEMKKRLIILLGDAADDLWISTFHSMGLRILRRNAQRLGYSSNFTVYDDDDSKSLMKQILKGKNIDDKRYPPASFLKAIDRAKNMALSPEDVIKKQGSYEQSIQAEIYVEYQKMLVANDAMDFGDLLLNTVRLFREAPDVLAWYQEKIKFLLVDEFQDTNPVQFILVKALSAKWKNVLVVGDDDQSIYAFRGATVQNILSFEKDFPGAKVVKLEQNYRSTGNILDSAHAVIEKNTERKAKKLWTDLGAGNKIKTYCAASEREEADFIASQIKLQSNAGIIYRDFAIFYRTNAQSRALEEALLTAKIPYRIYGGLKFYERKEVKDIIAYLRLVSNTSDNQAFLRIINTPPRGIGAQTVQSIVEKAEANTSSFYQAAEEIAASNKGVRSFMEMMQSLRALAEKSSLGDLIREIVAKSEYEKRLAAMNDVTAEARIENIRELISIGVSSDLSEALPSEKLRSFLDRIALTSSQELPVEETKEKNLSDKEPPNMVSLMTLHLAKGLEYEVVFFCGLEEGLLPHYRSIDDPVAIQEERRLCYVGMTRARHSLYLTRARSRGMFSSGGNLGSFGQYREVSRFAFDIPRPAMEDEGKAFFNDLPLNLLNDDIEFDDGGYQGGFQQRKKGTTQKRPMIRDISGLVKPADAVFAEEPLSSYSHLPLLESEEIGEGRNVIHPTFGKGKIVGSEGVAEEGQSVKVLISFDKFPEVTKKLVFKFAGLRKA